MMRKWPFLEKAKATSSSFDGLVKPKQLYPRTVMGGFAVIKERRNSYDNTQLQQLESHPRLFCGKQDGFSSRKAGTSIWCKLFKLEIFLRAKYKKEE